MFIHARQCLYIISLYCREVFPILSISLLYPKEPSRPISKQLGKKDFSMGQLPTDSYMLLCKQKNSISMNKQILSL